MPVSQNLPCPVCGGVCSLLDVVDFNKCCEESRNTFLPLSGIAVYYSLCGQCGFCFAPEFSGWTELDFAEKIYNAQYVLVDPSYVSVRPKMQAEMLMSSFGPEVHAVRHLDYGGGAGQLSRLLNDAGWHSTTYDPYVDSDVCIDQLGQFDFISAFEVFEHVPDVNVLMSRLSALLAPEGVVVFSTQLSDGNIKPFQRLSWWYAAPRNGHISLYSARSLATLAQRYGLKFKSFNDGMHAFWRKVPPWAAHILPATA